MTRLLTPIVTGALAGALAGGLACGGRAAPAPRPSLDAPAAPAAGADLARPVAAIEVRGLPADRAAAARRLIASPLGEPVDRHQLRRDIKAVWNLGGIADVVVRAVDVEGGVRLRFEVVERPRIGAIEVAGADGARGRFDPRSTLALEPGGTFDPVAVRRGCDLVLAAYRALGFAFAEVAWTSRPAGPSKVDVHVAVTEGPAVELRRLGFRGNKRVATRELERLLAGGGGGGAGAGAGGIAGVAIGGPYVRQAVQAGLVHLNAAYYDRGHIDVRVGPVEERFTAERDAVELVVPIVEGPRYRIGALRVEGALVAAEKEYLRLLGVARGQVFDRSKVGEGVARLVALHRDRGQPEPRIEPVTHVAPGTHIVDLTFQVLAP